MKQLARPLVHEGALVAAGALNALVFAILMWRLDGPMAALVGAAGGAFPWACIALLQRTRRGDSWISGVPLILAIVLTGAALALSSVAATWAGTCWDCATTRYHDPPTRGFMFFVWTWMVWLILNASLVLLALFAFGGRLFVKRAGGRRA